MDYKINVSTPKVNLSNLSSLPRFTMPAKFSVGRNNTAQSGAVEKQLRAESKMKTYR